MRMQVVEECAARSNCYNRRPCRSYEQRAPRYPLTRFTCCTRYYRRSRGLLRLRDKWGSTFLSNCIRHIDWTGEGESGLTTVTLAPRCENGSFSIGDGMRALPFTLQRVDQLDAGCRSINGPLRQSPQQRLLDDKRHSWIEQAWAGRLLLDLLAQYAEHIALER